MDNLKYELDLYGKGYDRIAGVDEVGRGCLAGPVYACSIIMKKDSHIEGVTDSKKLSDKKRRALVQQILSECECYQVIAIDNKKIDEINILEASRLAMEKAIKNMAIKPDYILTDAMELHTKIPYLALIKGDMLSYTIACASIVAKVARDDYMISLAKKYPGYGFEKHKGYPTKAHKEALKNLGVTKVHRKSYEPVKQLLEQ